LKRPECESLRNKLLKFLSETEKEIKRKERNEKNKSYFVNYINSFVENYE
jgi:hypothetical protein